MGYRTLEEKFLADFEELENENKRLRDEIVQLDTKLFEESVNRVLDIAVKTAGRREIIKRVMPSWNWASAVKNDFTEWVIRSSYENELPVGVSMNDFITYFEDELTGAYEEKYSADTKEEGE